MEKIVLTAKSRQGLGTQASKRIRREGFVPATIYGHGMKALSLQVSEREFYRIIHSKAGENVVIDLNVEDVELKESTCLIKDVQHHPVSDALLHVDFTVISMNEKIDIEVSIIALGVEDSPGLKAGGVLDIVHHEIEVNCLPTMIPSGIEVNVKDLEIGDSIHVKDLVMPEGVECNLEPESVVIAIHPPTVEEEAAAGEEGVAAEPEVIEKGKKEEAGAGDGEKS